MAQGKPGQGFDFLDPDLPKQTRVALAALTECAVCLLACLLACVGAELLRADADGDGGHLQAAVVRQRARLRQGERRAPKRPLGLLLGRQALAAVARGRSRPAEDDAGAAEGAAPAVCRQPGGERVRRPGRRRLKPHFRFLSCLLVLQEAESCVLLFRFRINVPPVWSVAPLLLGSV